MSRPGAAGAKKRQETGFGQSSGNRTGEVSLERGLPASLEAERSILGSILLDPELYFEAVSFDLTADHFFLDAHRWVFAGMKDLRESDIPPDMTTLVEWLDRKKKIEAIGGVAYLSSLIDGVPDRPSIEHYVRIVIRKALLRGLINISENAIAEAVEHSDEADVVLMRAEQAILRLRAQGTKKAVRVSDFAKRIIDKWVDQATKKSKDSAVELTTGYKELDKLTTGLRRKEYSVVGGYQKDGKTSLCMQCVLANLFKGYRVLYFSHEMDREAVLMRLVVMLTNIDHFHLRDPRELTMVELQELQSDALLRQLDALPLFVQDLSSMHIGKIEAQTRIHVRQDKIDLALVDFLQKVENEGATRAEQVSGSSKRLACLAKDENIHIQALSQFKNPPEGRKSKPHEFSFKESGDIIGDCHVALAVYRPKDETGYTGRDELGVLLQRAGPGGVWIEAHYNTKSLQWESRPPE